MQPEEDTNNEKAAVSKADEQADTHVTTHTLRNLLTSAGALYALSLICVALFITGAYMLQMPARFPTNTVISVEKGQSLDQVATKLQNEQVITSPLAFRFLVQWMGQNSKVVAGQYYFQEPHSVISVAERISSGEYGLVPHAVTIPEGATTFQMARILEDKLGEDNFDSQVFLQHAVPLEGYLFPDTYSFLPTTEEKKIVKTMHENFQRHIQQLRPEIDESAYSLPEIVIMASLLEKEARTTRSRRMVAGILYNRLEQDMRLQVDAVFTYINGKSTFDLTLADLSNDSPYNTYRYKGLPVGPIANPGMDSLKAAVNPANTDYMYYLSDMEGQMHYAENFEEHKQNKRRYLN